MKKRILLTSGIIAALAIALMALPSHSAARQDPDTAALSAKLQSLQAQMASLKSLATLQELQKVVEPMVIESDDEPLVLSDDNSSWLGVETHEVTADSVKNLKLPAERGVVIGKIVADSPAAKAGLRENDVVTEINGQRIEGAAQFRRSIREIPAGRTVQLTIWRDGRAQQLSATLGKSQEGRGKYLTRVSPGTFSFRMPEVQIPEIPQFEFNGDGLWLGGRPRLGIDAEDLDGQLGAYFGAPEGQGVLVREVTPGSPAEKAGVKAGDVITQINGERVHSIGDLREKIVAKHDESSDKAATLKLGVLRNHSELTLTAELPAPEKRTRQFVTHRREI